MNDDLQLRTLHLHGELLARAQNYAGQLILTAGPESSATGLPAAASLAGAASLTVDPNPAAVRAAIRHGAADFVVNTLDEALRALKNEIRQHRPLAIILTADPEAVCLEALDRGLLPDLTINAPTYAGKQHLALTTEYTEALTAWLSRHGWQQGIAPPGFILPPTDPRAAILTRLPRYQRLSPRDPRFLWLSPEENICQAPQPSPNHASRTE